MTAPIQGLNVDPARATALHLLTRSEAGDVGLDEMFEGLEKGDPSAGDEDLDRRDVRFVRQLVAGVTKWRLHLDWILQPHSRRPLDGLTPTVRQALRLALYQMRWLDRVPSRAAVHTAVELTKRIEHKGAASFVNAVLRSVSRSGDETEYPDIGTEPARHLSVVHSHPRWLVERWLNRWGTATTQALLEANNRQPKLFAQRNPLRADHETFIEGLPAGAHPRQLAETMYEVTAPEGFFESKTFRQGAAWVQDVAAIHAVRVLEPRPGDHMLDLCAAPGGKSIQAAVACGDRIHLIACDRSALRLRRLQENCSRLGLTSIRCLSADGDHLPFLDTPSTGPPFDRVLLDAPCSGTGVLRRHAEARWNKRPPDLAGHARRQLGLLQAGFAALKPGGALVYSTCSLEREENEDVVEAFVSRQADARLADAGEDGERYVQRIPGTHEGDGSFAALLHKVKSPC